MQQPVSPRRVQQLATSLIDGPLHSCEAGSGPGRGSRTPVNVIDVPVERLAHRDAPRYPVQCRTTCSLPAQRKRSWVTHASFTGKGSRSLPRYSGGPSCTHYGDKRTTLGLNPPKAWALIFGRSGQQIRAVGSSYRRLTRLLAPSRSTRRPLRDARKVSLLESVSSRSGARWLHEIKHEGLST
jgi:hypothetical protein